MAAIAAGASLAVAAYWLVEGRIRVPLVGWTLFESRFLRWVSMAGLLALGLVCLLIAVGGLFALHEDAKEGRDREGAPNR